MKRKAVEEEGPIARRTRAKVESKDLPVVDLPKRQKAKKKTEKKQDEPRPLTFATWQRESLRGHLLTRGVVVLDIHDALNSDIVVHVLGCLYGMDGKKVEKLGDKKLLRRKLKQLPAEYEFELTSQTWCSTPIDIIEEKLPADRAQASLYLATPVRYKPNPMFPVVPWEWEWRRYMHHSPSYIKLQFWDRRFKFPFKWRSGDTGLFISFGSFWINWPLTREYHHDRDNYPFMRDLIHQYTCLRLEPLVELVVSFFDVVLPAPRCFRPAHVQLDSNILWS